MPDKPNRKPITIRLEQSQIKRMDAAVEQINKAGLAITKTKIIENGINAELDRLENIFKK